MQQLTIKHLGRRLAYGLKVCQFDEQFIDGYRVLELAGLSEQNRYLESDLDEDEKHLIHVREITFWIKGKYGLNSTAHTVKPILRPLTDLTKEIEHKGEKFVPIVRISELYPNVPNWNSFSTFWISTANIKDTIVEHCVFEWLLEHHFHIDEPEGTWIDVNSLPENPYK